MRIWSLHPKYLDAKGIVALWRESLLALNVLDGKTKGYLNHPQLNRFKSQRRPVAAINTYLRYVFDEATARSYNFNARKIGETFQRKQIAVTKGQMDYEWKHLLKKLRNRDEARFKGLKKTRTIDVHPLFFVVKGAVEEWEIVD